MSGEKQEVIKCPFFDSGYCKYGEKCHYKHFPEKCQKDKCNDKNCTFRHPRTSTGKNASIILKDDHVTIVHDDGKSICNKKCN